jgi:phosphoglycolate phosphatase
LYKLAIFDFDGTLVDSVPGIVNVMTEVFHEYQIDKALFDKWSHAVGIPLPKQMEIVFPDRTADFHEELSTRYRQIYDVRVIDICPLFPGLHKMLSALSEAEVQMAIVTSKRRHLVEAVLEHHNLSSYFKMVLGAQDVQNHKPHPEAVHLTVQNLAIDLRDVVVVGDSTFDLDMATNAGVDAIGVTTGIHTHEILEASEPIHIAAGLHEVLPIILNGRAKQK